MGPDCITDPAFLVTRYRPLTSPYGKFLSNALKSTSSNMEDFVTWVDTSKLKRTVMTYNDEVGADWMREVIAKL